jgi:hypothetical protein
MRKITYFPRPKVPVTECKWVVTNGYQWAGIFRFEADAKAKLANLKDDNYFIVRGAR